jgi:phosphomannomutase
LRAAFASIIRKNAAMDIADLRARAERWIAADPDPATREELRYLLARPDLDESDLADRFAGSLEFGTAGLRGVLGAGPNRMNRAVVARATWALAREILASVPDAAERGVVVGGDARRMSPELSLDVARILAGAGLRVVLFATPVPTPVVGFTVKRLHSAAGVVITASHNPPEYNGYKVYWEDAAQIVPPVDARLAAAIEGAPDANLVACPPAEVLRAQHRLVDAPDDAAREYLRAVRALAVHPTEGDRRLRIVYTPLHGVGDALVHQALADAGFSSVTSVAEQRAPDGAFPTVAFPNPEEPGTMDLALALGTRLGADLVLANDPDVDRLAVAIPRVGGFEQLTGNEVGVLLGHYLLSERTRTGPCAVVTSIVSSPWLARIAADLGATCEQTLTGFKWIAQRSIELERHGIEFVFGYEEALGYCVGNAVRDKDGISAATLIAELAAVLRARRRTLRDELDSIARRWGVFTSMQVNVTRPGASGAERIRRAMAALQAEPPAVLDGDEVVAVADFARRVRRDQRTGAETALSLPASSVISLELASGARVIARPSGTEPKAKLYIDVSEGVRPSEAVGEARGRATAVMLRLAGAFEAAAAF